MEKFCITLDQAKRLVELGFERDYSFSWVEIDHSEGKKYFFNRQPSYLDHLPWRDIPAYHVGELGEILTYEHLHDCGKSSDGSFSTATRSGYGFDWVINDYPTEAQSRGALLIYLLENNLL